MNYKRIFGLLICLLMMSAAAVCVNKSLFGHKFNGQKEKSITAEGDFSTISADTLTLLPDGTEVIHSAPLYKKAGYAGPVPIDIYVKDGKISDIKALPNAETPTFFNRASTLFSEWKGLSPKEAADLKVDAVSGATYSSAAIIGGVDAALDHYINSPHSSSAPAMPWKMWIALAVTLSACIFPLFVKNKIYNRVQLIANIVVLGFWCGQFLDYSLMLGYLSHGISLPVGLTAIAMLTAAFIYPLFGHTQHYCNHICPLGSAQVLVAELCRYKIKMSPRVLKALDWFRKILWALLMLALWGDVFTSWMDLELFQAFIVKSAPIGIIVAAIAFVALSAVVARPYCRFVCPTGSLFKQAENPF